MSSLPTNVAIWLYNVAGVRWIQLTEFNNLRIERLLQGSEVLAFELSLSDPKLNYIFEEQLLRFEPDDGERWFVEHFEDARPGFRTVFCNPTWIRLGNISKFGPTSILAKNPSDGVTQILTGSGWTLGSGPAGGDLYTAEEMDGTVLSLLRRWSAVTGYELEFDGAAKTVSLVSQVGTNVGIGFSYSHNLAEIKRSYSGPEATRLYPVGANNMTIENANPDGLRYIEDYSWYTDQGLTLIQARALYRKDVIWNDQRYLTEVNLYDAAVARLANMSQPRITYQAKVVDIQRLLTTDQTPTFQIGDNVRVTDEILGIDVETRIVRLVRYPLKPLQDEVELGFLNNGLLDVTEGSNRDINYGDIFTIVDANIDPITSTSGESNLCEISVTSTGAALAITGATMIGVASGAGTITFRLTIDGITIGSTRSIDFSDEDEIEYSFPSFASDLAEGSHDIHWRAQITSGAGTVLFDADHARAWVLLRGAIGVGINTSPNSFISELLEDLYVMPLSDEFVVEFIENVDHVVGEEETISPEDEETLTDRFIIPFTIGDPVFGMLDGPGQLSQPD